MSCKEVNSVSSALIIWAIMSDFRGIKAPNISCWCITEDLFLCSLSPPAEHGRLTAGQGCAWWDVSEGHDNIHLGLVLSCSWLISDITVDIASLCRRCCAAH